MSWIKAQLYFSHIAVFWLLFLGCAAETGCHRETPTITFTEVPESSPGGPDTDGVISGSVQQAPADSFILLFARANAWWVQPDVHSQRVSIQSDGTWTSRTHLGTEYAAVLIHGDYKAAEHSASLPAVGKSVRAVKIVKGRPSAVLAADKTPRPFRFGGLLWQNTAHMGELDGEARFYLPGNATMDRNGALHLRIRTIGSQHTCAEVSLPQTLGYGTYRFTIAVPRVFDPAAEFSFYTSSDRDQPGEHRQMEVHLSQWGDPQNANAEYVIEPYFVSANVHRFEMQPGDIKTTLKWSPGRAEFSSEPVGQKRGLLTRWIFNTGVPASRNEEVFFNLCPFAYPKHPFRQDAEIVIKHFEFVP